MEKDWISLGVRPSLAGRLAEAGLAEPAPVQSAAIPAMLEGRDLCVRSHTGSGKTLAYLLPALQRIETERPDLQALVMAPTQELAMQIVREAERFGGPEGVRVQQLIGGASVSRQIDGLKRKPHLAVGTPGRLHELLKMRKLKLHAVKLLVLDEADQMFALGSTKELEAVLDAVPGNRQLAFFSATLPEKTLALADRLMREPVRIDLDPDSRLPASIRHYALRAERRAWFDTAKRLLHALKPASALFFFDQTDQLAHWEARLRYEGFAAGVLYGDADKLTRSRMLERLRAGKLRIVLTTDVAARGIDIPELMLVVSLGVPADPERYVHRAGRTGRMGREGTVVSIVDDREWHRVGKLARKLGIAIEERELYGGRLIDPAERKRSERAGRAGSGDHVETAKGKASGAGLRAKAARAAAVDPANGAGDGGSAAGALSRRKAAASDKPDAAKSRAATDAPGAPKTPDPGPRAAAARPRAGAKSKRREREIDRKNKGAPRWLKAKWESEGQPIK